MAKPELGNKRQCLSCGTKFFDLNKDPILCPKCGAVFQAAQPTRAAQRAAVADDEEDTEAEAGADMVTLEDADAESDKTAAADVDIEIEDDESAEDDTFLEEEEEDSDDVSDLIDSDLEDDEEG